MKSHRDNSEKYISRDGNLITIMKGFANIASVFDKLLESGQKNTKMIRWKIQNEVILCIAKVVRREIRNILENVKYYALIADEVTHHYANKEILPLWLRIL